MRSRADLAGLRVRGLLRARLGWTAGYGEPVRRVLHAVANATEGVDDLLLTMPDDIRAACSLPVGGWEMNVSAVVGKSVVGALSPKLRPGPELVPGMVTDPTRRAVDLLVNRGWYGVWQGLLDREQVLRSSWARERYHESE